MKTLALAQTAAPNAARLSNRDPNAETVMKITAPFTVTAVGDIIEPQPLYSNDPAFQKLVARIRQADVGFGNMESSLVDFHTFQGPVAGTEEHYRNWLVSVRTDNVVMPDRSEERRVGKECLE